MAIFKSIVIYRQLFYTDTFTKLFMPRCFISKEIHGKTDKRRFLKSICLHVVRRITNLCSVSTMPLA